MSFGAQDLFSSSPSLALEFTVQPKGQTNVQSQLVIRNASLEGDLVSLPTTEFETIQTG